jgi:hypothetical protein
VQIVHGSRRGSRTIEHIGSAHDELELEALKAAARQRLAAGQGELDLGLDGSLSAAVVPSTGPSARPLEIVSSRMGHLWDGLSSAYDVLGFGRAAGGDEVFRQLVLARIIEPTSKQDSPRVLAEVGVDTVSYPTLNRHLRGFSVDEFRGKLAAACAAHARLGPASLVLYDVSTLYFETDAGDGFREPGFSKERRLEPQITIGLLTDAAGFPLMVEAFEVDRVAVPLHFRGRRRQEADAAVRFCRRSRRPRHLAVSELGDHHLPGDLSSLVEGHLTGGVLPPRASRAQA